MNSVVPRWEWRSFGDDLGLVAARFTGEQAEAQESEELYLLSAVTDKSVKVRAGLLDIKSLEQVDAAGLEQWRPELKAAFPLSRPDAERLLAVLQLSTADTRDRQLSLDELLANLEHRGVRAVALHKRRRRYTIAGCMAEMTDVLLGGGAGTCSVAVESEHPERVRAAVEDLGLSGRANVSYPRWLAQKVGHGG